jgi:hypothetical protein
MPGITKEIQKLFYTGEQFMDNTAADPEASALLRERGIDDVVLAEGRALYEAARAATAANEASFAAQLQATDDLKQVFEASWAETQDLAHILATVFEGQIAALTLLGLHKRRDASTGASEIAWPQNKSLPFYLAWARNLYARLAEVDLGAGIAPFGYSAEVLADMAARVEQVSDLDNAQERAKAWARQSTVERDEAVAAFKAWLDQQIVIARVALKGKKRLLELLGLR